MMENLLKLHKQAIEEILNTKDLEQLEKVELQYFGRKKGELTLILKGLKKLAETERKEIGPRANEIKNQLYKALEQQKQSLLYKKVNQQLESDRLDVSLPGKKSESGHMHPSSIVQYELEDVFKSLGFMILDGPELESDYFNFEALNIPPHHPARDMQDTFYVKREQRGQREQSDKLVLRTHTSNVQVRALLKYGAPIRAVVPGRVFRYEAIDASHDNTFYQMEGLMVDKNISVVNLIAVMKTLLAGIFKRDVEVRLRPGFFPFVEPGFELDIKCLICKGKGCSVCKHTGWLELLPCGMIHPNVLKAGKIDTEKYSGFAFGLGLTRLVMMRYGIEDIRHLTGGDLRFLKQF